MIRADQHTHSSFSTDSTAAPEEMLQGAISKGLTHLCLTDHMDLEDPTDKPYPEFVFDPAKYFATLTPLKEKYADQIQIRLGLEVEYYPDRMADLLKLIENVGIEYMILGHHWCGNEQGQPYNGRPTDDENRLRQ